MREADLADLEKCRGVLRRLHALGVAYGERYVKRHSFLVCEEERALLQGFGGAFETGDGEGLQREMDKLEGVLATSLCRRRWKWRRATVSRYRRLDSNKNVSVTDRCDYLDNE